MTKTPGRIVGRTEALDLLYVARAELRTIRKAIEEGGGSVIVMRLGACLEQMRPAIDFLRSVSVPDVEVPAQPEEP